MPRSRTSLSKGHSAIFEAPACPFVRYGCRAHRIRRPAVHVSICRSVLLLATRGWRRCCGAGGIEHRGIDGGLDHRFVHPAVIVPAGDRPTRISAQSQSRGGPSGDRGLDGGAAHGPWHRQVSRGAAADGARERPLTHRRLFAAPLHAAVTAFPKNLKFLNVLRCHGLRRIGVALDVAL